MSIKLLNVGFGNIVLANRIVAIVNTDSAPMKRLKEDARERGMLIDATHGRRTQAILVTDSKHVVPSAVQPETSAGRFLNKEVKVEKEEAFEEEQQREGETGNSDEEDE